MQKQSALAKIRGKLHTEIRREQLQLKFKTNRQRLLIQISSKDTPIEKKILDDNLVVVKKAMEWPKERHNLINSLEKLQNLFESFNATNYLLKAVKLDSECERAKKNSSLQYCTWMDLFLTMLQQNKDEPVLQICASILSNITYGLKITMQLELINHLYMQQHKRLLQNYPYCKLKEPNYKIVSKSLNFLYNIAISCNDATGMYYLLNDINPNIMQLLLCVKQGPEFKEIQKQFAFTSTTVLFCTNSLTLPIVENENYNNLVMFVGKYLINDILTCDDLQNFQKQCKLIQGLCYCHQSDWLNQSEFEALQQLFCCQFSRDNLQFFEMMSRIVFSYNYKLSIKTVQLLLQKLLHIQGQISHQQQLFYHSIVATFKYHIFNCGNRLLPEDQYSFVSALQSKSRELGILSRFLEKYNYLTFKSLLQVMSCLIADDPVHSCGLLQNQLKPLMEHDEFKALLLENFGIEIEPQQSQQL